ncbi:MAG: InlB B-repeat-containing protein [Lachnospira sp.]
MIWAKWEVNEYTITFEINGGTEIAPKTTVKWTDTVLDGVSDPTRSGFSFDGWKCGDVTVTAQTTYRLLVSSDAVTSIELKEQWKDTTAPEISGVENGKIYCSAQIVCVSDNDVIKSVTVNGKTVTLNENNQFTLLPEGTQTIIVTDNAGNISAEMIVTVNDTVIAKLPPEIIEGKGQSLTAGEMKNLTFRSNAAFSDFIRVELDGKNLDEKNYTDKEGSTVVTLKADYVGALSAGDHTIGIVSTSGTATTTFIVNVNPSLDNNSDSSQTGDNSYIALWVAGPPDLYCLSAVVTSSSSNSNSTQHNHPFFVGTRELLSPHAP